MIYLSNISQISQPAISGLVSDAVDGDAYLIPGLLSILTASWWGSPWAKTCLFFLRSKNSLVADLNVLLMVARRDAYRQHVSRWYLEHSNPNLPSSHFQHSYGPSAFLLGKSPINLQFSPRIWSHSQGWSGQISILALEAFRTRHSCSPPWSATGRRRRIAAIFGRPRPWWGWWGQDPGNHVEPWCSLLRIPSTGGVVVLLWYNTNGAATGRAQSLAVPKPVSYRGTGEWRVAAGRLGQVFRHVRRQHLGLSSSVAFFGFLDMLVSSGWPTQVGRQELHKSYIMI